MEDKRIRNVLLLRSADLKSSLDAINLLNKKSPNSTVYVLAQEAVAGFLSENAKFASIVKFPYRDFNMAVPASCIPKLPLMDVSFSLYKNDGNGYDEVDAFLVSKIKSREYGSINSSFDISYGKLSDTKKQQIIRKGMSLLYGGSLKAKERSNSFNKTLKKNGSFVVFSGDSEIIIDEGGSFTISPVSICRFGYVPPDWKYIRDEGKAMARVQQNATFEINGSCNFFNGVKLNIFSGAKFAIGNGSYIAFNSRIFVEKEIKIGANCAISWDVEMFDTDFHRISVSDDSVRRQGIFIGDNAWIGSGSRLLKGVHLGNNVIVAAGAVVTGCFPDNSIIGGNPAKLIGMKEGKIRI